MVFSPSELALVDLNGLIRTADLLRAALQVYQQCFSAEHTPVRDRVIVEVMFALEECDRFAAQNAVRELQNLLNDEFTLLKPRAVPNGPRPIAPGSSYHPSTSPSKTIYNTRISVPGHIATAEITLHLTTN